MIPVDIRHGRSAIDLYRYFVSLKPRNKQGELKDLRDQVLDAGTPTSTIKAIKLLPEVCARLREWNGQRLLFENMSGQAGAADMHYQDRLRDVVIHLITPVLSKVGALGGTLGTALESRKTMKRITTGEHLVELTWSKMMDESVTYGEENATPHTVSPPT